MSDGPDQEGPPIYAPPPPPPAAPPHWKLWIANIVLGAVLWAYLSLDKLMNRFVYGRPPEPIVSRYMRSPFDRSNIEAVRASIYSSLSAVEQPGSSSGS